MAIKSVETELQDAIAERDARIAELEATVERERQEAELWRRRFLNTMRAWPAFTLATATFVAGILVGRVL